MKRKFLSVLLAMSMVLAMLPATAMAAGFDDTDGHWAEGAIVRWSQHGIVEGDEGMFYPNGDLSRAQLAAILARLLKLPAAPDAGFGDTDDHWAEDVINRCYAAGIMMGDGVNANPDRPISREETMVMLGRALGIKPVENADLSGYEDDHAVSSWAVGYVAAMTSADIVNGIDGNLAPAEEIDRASTMTILDRAISTYATEAGQTVAADGGIVIVAAEDVTVTGAADAVVVTAAAAESTTKLENANVGTVTVQAAESSVVVGQNSTAVSVEVSEQAAGAAVEVTQSAAVGTVTTAAPESTVAVAGSVVIVETTETAAATKVETAAGSTVGTVTTAAPESTVTVAGTVGTVETTETATSTKVEAAAGSTITNVSNAADGTTVSGAGKVENVTTSGNNTTVNTSGTKVETAVGTTGTTAGNQTVTGGSTTTTTPTAPSVPPVHVCIVVSSVVTAPTCTEQGYTTHTTCCGAVSYSDYVPATGHKDGTAVCCDDKIHAYTATGLTAAVALGGEVILEADIDLPTAVVVTKNVTLNLNGKTLTVTNDPSGDGVFWVKAGGNLTINGEGTVNGVGKSKWCMAIWADGGNVVINGGTYTNVGANTDPGSTQYDLIYAKNGGSVTINGGTFTSETPFWTLNKHDSTNGNIIVKGGTFIGYNPSVSNTENPTANFVAEGYYATQSNGNWTVQAVSGTADSAEELIAAVAMGGEITLGADIDLPTAVVVTKNVTLNLNNKTLTVTNDPSGDGVFWVKAGGNLTINGEGTVNGKGKNNYNMAIWADGGNVIINGGTYTNEGATATVDPAHFDLIYVKNGGSVTINGGTFTCQTPAWVLNKHDGTRDTSEMIVKGGTFVGFNPANNAAEGANTNFVDDGYEVKEDNGTYTVEPFKLDSKAELLAALAEGGTVTLDGSITYQGSACDYGNADALMTGGMLNGNNKIFAVTDPAEPNKDGHYDYTALSVNGGTIKDLTINDGFRAIFLEDMTANVTLDNLTLGGEGVCYCINTGANENENYTLTVTNSRINGWTSFNQIASASFTNCTFGQGSYYTDESGRLLKPYVNTTVENCSFINGFYLDLSSLEAGCTVTLDGCDVGGVALTAELCTASNDWNDYDGTFFIELPAGRTLTDCVIFQ